MSTYFQILNRGIRKAVLYSLVYLCGIPGIYAQVTYNKHATGPIGEAPKVGNFSSNYGLDNVERSTGTVNINIPLYEIKTHDISVPISISYNALGLKVGQEAGAAGMGWELNAGGKIIRQINGLDDEDTFNGSVKSTSNFSLDPDNDSNDRAALTQVMNGNWDYAYDTYSYTVPGSGGRFTKNGLTFPYDPTFKYNPDSRKITTGNGLMYTFTAGEKLIVSKRIYYQEISGTHNMREIPGGGWKAAKEYDADYNLYMITSAKNKDTVKFEYRDTLSINPGAGIIAKDRITTTEILGLNRLMMRKADNTWGDADGEYYFQGEPVIGQTKIETKKHSRIKAITYATGRVEFEYNPIDVLGQDELVKIRISQKVNGIYKRLKFYKFNYDPNIQYGHYLKDIEVFDADSAKAGKWKFKYYGEQFAGDTGKLPVAPNIESKAQDRWGFYNGQTGNKSLIENPDSMINLRDIPHLRACIKGHPGSAAYSFNYHRAEAKQLYNVPFDYLTTNVSFGNRSTNLNELIKGTLFSVAAPTGEVAEYVYENNKYQIIGTNSGGTNYTKIYGGGGIRVKSILLRDGAMFSAQTLSKKTFTYGSGTLHVPGNTDNGYGIVNIPGVISSAVCSYIYNTTITPIENLLCYSHPLNDLTIYNGSSAYYPSVTESTYSGINLKHQTTYYFDLGIETGAWNFPTPSSYVQLGFPEFYINRGIRRNTSAGQPVKIIEYNGARLNGTRARVTTNIYANFNAPLTTPKLYSFFGGVKGSVIQESNSTITTCVSVPVDGHFVYECNEVANVPNLDPLGYKFVGPEFSENYYPGKYYNTVEEMSSYSNVYKLVNTTTTTFNPIYVDSVVNGTNYYFDNIAHLQPTRITTFNSNSDTTETRIKYAHDFLLNTVSGVSFLRGANMVTEPVEQLSLVKKGGVYQVLGGTLNTFNSNYGLVLNGSTYRFDTGGKLTALGSNTESDIRYKLESNNETYDNLGNPTLYTTSPNEPKTALIWGYNQQYPVAEVLNAPSGSTIAFTNFEGPDKGYWTYSGSPVMDITSPSKDHVYALSGGAVTKTGLTPGKYILGYWYKTGSSVTVSGGTGTEVVKNTKGYWIFAERELTVSGSSLTVSGSGYIDELRFCPADALMRTFTYNPGIGITGSLDIRGQSSTYEYDNEQRVKNIKDQNGNIIKAYDYHIGSLYKE